MATKKRTSTRDKKRTGELVYFYVYIFNNLLNYNDNKMKLKDIGITKKDQNRTVFVAVEIDGFIHNLDIESIDGNGNEIQLNVTLNKETKYK